MTKAKQVRQIHQMTIAQFEAQFPDEDHCKQYLTNNRWPEGVICPRCGNPSVREHGTLAYHWQCYNCAPGTSYRFSVLVDTIFENTNKPLREWFRVIHLMLTSKKGISALQVMRYMGFGSYKTAWGMCTKVRTALGNVEFRQLTGSVEIDETYIGGKAKNKHRNKIGGRGDGGQGGGGKSIVIGAVKRKGNVIARVISRMNTDTARQFIQEVCSTRVSLLSTDEHRAYASAAAKFEHHQVNHSREIWKTNSIHGSVHTNTIEGFWSIVKRGVMGTFHKVSHKYLPLYVNEFQFRYNNRMNEDIFGAAIRAC